MKRTNPSGRSALLWSCTAMIAMQLAVSGATLVRGYDFNSPPDTTPLTDLLGGGCIGAA